jgi:nucleoside-diphosphate-sugar epimerase
MYLVTGGNGFIGYYVVKQLVKNGYAVRIIDILPLDKNKKMIKDVEYVIGDITDLETCIKVSKDVIGVFHLAAFSRSGPSFTKSFECHNTNVYGTLNILEACKINNIKKIVYSGSSTFYGNILGPQLESIENGDFLNFYGLTKYIGELYVKQYARNYGMEFNILRYFNVYGEFQPNDGEYALVVSIFLKKYIEGKPLEIHGDGNQRRDFIHVEDVARANLLAMFTNNINNIINIGYGKNYSIFELASFFNSPITYKERRIGDALETLADISKAKDLLLWHPKVDLETGINILINKAKEKLIV